MIARRGQVRQDRWLPQVVGPAWLPGPLPLAGFMARAFDRGLG